PLDIYVLRPLDRGAGGDVRRPLSMLGSGEGLEIEPYVLGATDAEARAGIEGDAGPGEQERRWVTAQAENAEVQPGKVDRGLPSRRALAAGVSGSTRLHSGTAT
ncbi:hypothetical protein, partial [Actinoplanes couchii]